jgi:signal transduction histidine kinase
MPGGATYSCNVAVIVDELGEQRGRVATMRDITAITDLVRSRSRFVERISQDLRRPLTLIRSYAKMLPVLGPLADRQQEFVASILESVEQTGELVESLLSLSGLEGSGDEDRRPVLLSSVVTDVVRGARDQAAKRGAFLRAGPLDKAAITVGDATQLRQAISILVGAAIGDASAGDPVRVELKQTGALALVRVSAGSAEPAPGPGAASVSARVGGGDGAVYDSLQMATVRAVVEKYGGSLRVEVRSAGGVSYAIALPAIGSEDPS